MEEHKRAVDLISRNVKTFHETNKKWRVYHGSTSSTRTQNFTRPNIIDTSSLDHVLSISRDTMTALVEPKVSMAQLVDATLLHGLIPPVVMEFPAITVGGGFSGTAAESSSFKHGLFEQTIKSIEIVLANGDVVNTKETQNIELLHGAAGAFGTLGVITMLEIDLIPAQPFVQLSYVPVKSVNSAIKEMEKAMQPRAQNDYVDAIMFSATTGVVMTGRLTVPVAFFRNFEASRTRETRFSRARDPLFYQHVENVLSRKNVSTYTDMIPTRDYLFRYDRGAFWGAKYAWSHFLVPLNRITTFLLNPFLHTQTMYAALHKSGLAKQYIIQDCVFPVSTAPQFVSYCQEQFGLWPLWLCPLNYNKSVSPHGVHPDLFNFKKDNVEGKSENSWLCNVGIWGPCPGRRKREDFVRVNREIEAKVKELGGVKTLYAHSYYTEEEFDEIYDKQRYTELRKNYHAGGLPTVYEKVRVDPDEKTRLVDHIKAIWPLGGLYGVFSVLVGSDYVMVNKISMEDIMIPLLGLLGVTIALIVGISATR